MNKFDKKSLENLSQEELIKLVLSLDEHNSESKLKIEELEFLNKQEKTNKDQLLKKFEKKDDEILKYIKEDSYVYFVHSYFANSSNKELIAYCEYEKKIPAIVRKDNVYGLQFHPEKSGEVGQNILSAYKELIVK